MMNLFTTPDPEAITVSEASRGRRESSVAKKRAASHSAWEAYNPVAKDHHTIYRGDSRKMAGLPRDTQAQLVVTSPPYWDLKSYANDLEGAQLGHITDRREFLANLNRVWRRCYNLLIPGGRMCVVVGDVCRSRKSFGRHRVEPLHAYILIECQKIGFDPLSPVLWHKISNVATEVTGNGTTFLGKPYEPNAVIKSDVEYILLFRKPGEYRHPTPLQRALSVIEKEDHRRWFRQVWDDVPGEIQRDHPAPFPREIAKRLIGMFSFVGDTVLDPFWGIGNTTLAAIEMHRSSIGFEIEPQYVEVGKRRMCPPPRSVVKFIDRER